MNQVRSFGIYHEPRFGGYGEKVDGQHRWAVFVTYRVSQGQASAALHGAQVNLDMENMADLQGPGCIDCEQPYSKVSGEACPAPAYDEGPGRG